VPATAVRTVADFPDLLPLRDNHGAVTGLFSDCGAWYGLTWGGRYLLDVHDLQRGRIWPLHLGGRVVRTRVWADCLEAELDLGARIRIAFPGPQAITLEWCHDEPPDPSTDLPFTVVRAGPERWLVVVAPEGGGVRDPDCFERNRRRWNALFARAFAGNRFAGWLPAETILARAVATLFWNHRAPLGDVPAPGVFPSSLAYRAYWGWDSWKHAHALAALDPALAAGQLRAQFSGQRSDGMVPDTVLPRASEDNWRNTKPPLAAWALEAVWAASGDRSLVAELLPLCSAFLHWYEEHRRREGAVLVQPGGRDLETAMWDTGWDDSLRFAGLPLQPCPDDWLLLDCWPADLNGWLLVEYRAVARLERVAGGDPRPWEERADALQDAILRELWDPELAFFLDRQPGAGRRRPLLSAAGWVPAWAGALPPAELGRLRRVLQDPRRFATPMPFPTLAADQEGHDPDGYWNGSVWLDHAALAVAVLGEEGEEAARRLFRHACAAGPLWECHSPVSGEPCRGARPAVAQFSWTACAFLEMARDSLRPAPRG